MSQTLLILFLNNSISDQTNVSYIECNDKHAQYKANG